MDITKMVQTEQWLDSETRWYFAGLGWSKDGVESDFVGGAWMRGEEGKSVPVDKRGMEGSGLQ